MKKKVSEFMRHPLVSGSSVVFVGFMAASLLNYVFNLAMGRMLSKSDYGVFASLVAIFNILSVFAATITTVFTKFTASYVGQKKEDLIGPLFMKGSFLVGGIAFLICGTIVIFASNISRFLNITGVLLTNTTAAGLLFAFLASVSLGILGGLLKFVYISFLNSFSSLVKLALGVLLVFWGARVFGALSAFFLANVFYYLLGFIPLIRFIKNNKGKNFSIPNLHKNLSLYALPVFLSSVGVTAFISIDIILVKHFFDAGTAGQYAALSLMGRAIFYVVSPITLVLFPLIAQKKERKEKLGGTLLLSAVLVGIPSIILSTIYFLFPKTVLGVFFPGAGYKMLASYLGPFSIFILFYGLSFLLNSFYLSIGRGKVSFFTIGASILEILFIVFFHQSLSQIITGLTVISFLLLLGLLLYYPHIAKTS